MKSNKIVTYTYQNEDATRIWTTLPLVANNHLEVKIHSVSHKPIESHSDSGGNMMYYFELKANEAFTIEYSIYSTSEQNHQPLTSAEREYYLRSGSLVTINNDIRTLAEDITSTASSDYVKAKLIFEYLVANYKYVYPPKSRGVLSFLEDKKGDCGEYSFLYAALCRSIGIPCRTVVGTWAIGKMNAHVWNEVYLEEHGWLPVDCSMAYVQKKQKYRFIASSIKTIPWRNYFGQTENQRVVFSKDAELQLFPAYQDSESLADTHPRARPLIINRKPFDWGFVSLNGAVPYMQPIYVQIASNQSKTKRKFNANDLLGKWNVKEVGFRRFLYLVKSITFPIFMVFLFLDFFIDNVIFDIIERTAGVIWGLTYLLRKESIIIFSIFTTLLLMSLLSVIF